MVGEMGGEDKAEEGSGLCGLVRVTERCGSTLSGAELGNLGRQSLLLFRFLS